MATKATKATSTTGAKGGAHQSDYDAIIVGGGHNGLVAAAYLARSGARTLVLEARNKTGGAASGDGAREARMAVGPHDDGAAFRLRAVRRDARALRHVCGRSRRDPLRDEIVFGDLAAMNIAADEDGAALRAAGIDTGRAAHADGLARGDDRAARAIGVLCTDAACDLRLAAGVNRPGLWTIETVLEAFPNLRPRRKALAGSLSGGEQQAAAIGRA